MTNQRMIATSFTAFSFTLSLLHRHSTSPVRTLEHPFFTINELRDETLT